MASTTVRDNDYRTEAATLDLKHAAAWKEREHLHAPSMWAIPGLLATLTQTIHANCARTSQPGKDHFLAPDIVERILAGTLPRRLTLAALLAQELPLSWTEQRRRLGLTEGAEKAAVSFGGSNGTARRDGGERAAIGGC